MHSQLWSALSLHFSVVEEVKGPGDYPMPPSPESNTPSDDSNEEKGKYKLNVLFLNLYK